MSPWTNRLLTKIKKLYVVRLLLPTDEGDQQPTVSARVYGFSSVPSFSSLRTASNSERHQVAKAKRHQPESSDGVESFSNSQSVPESCRGDSVATASSEPIGKQSEESVLNMKLSSTDEEEDNMTVATRKLSGCRQTPTVRISESSKLPDAKDIATLQSCLLASFTESVGGYRGGRVAFVDARSKTVAALASRTRAEQQQQQQKQKEGPEVSEPTSCQLPRRRTSGVTPGRPLSQSSCQDGSQEEGPEELLVAVVLNGIASADDGAASRSLEMRANRRKSQQKATKNKQQRRRAASTDRATDGGREGRRPPRQAVATPSTDDAGAAEAENSANAAVADATPVTRTFAFSVARRREETPMVASKKAASAETATAVRDGHNRRRRRQETASTGSRKRPLGSSVGGGRRGRIGGSDGDEICVTKRTVRLADATTASSISSSTETISSPGRQRRRRRGASRGRQQLRRPGVGETPFEPRFSKIIEWSESTASADC